MQLSDVETQCITPARPGAGRVTCEDLVDGVMQSNAPELMAAQ